MMWSSVVEKVCCMKERTIFMFEIIVVSLIVAFLWGFSPVVHRWVLPKVSSAFVLVISSIFYTLCVAIYVGCFHRRALLNDLKKSRQYIPIIAITTIFGLFLANILYLYVVKHTHNINVVTVIMSLYPVITLVLSSWLLKEGLDIRGLIGFVLILTGMMYMLSSHIQTKN